ncbi:hypothetical protein GRI62_06765 [Erythrobacter arachoides]|uniref:Uncharacterized protein n=1 Tax=Aurantiacibacter arachoides TaxID=1850444 RepID=A0A845A013_9SPHN|nr:hypothetical protein [Aurantiacibacter arachoides]MXO93308.1 hypothetical protein [Aurantiacibacter arachoides]GGD50373.1 hypothetical protein GCM10011411_07750 [Aurantiacibacter arachoides]
MDFVNPVFAMLWAAALAAILAVAHSVVGERSLIRPLLAENTGVLANPVYAKVTRLAWHWTSALWLVAAAVLALAAYGEITASWLVLAIGIGHLAFGLFDLGWTKGRHVSGAPIAIVGLLACLAVMASAPTV